VCLLLFAPTERIKCILHFILLTIISQANNFFNVLKGLYSNMRINFCCFAGITSQQNLNRAQICSLFKQMRGKTIVQFMWLYLFPYNCKKGCLIHYFLFALNLFSLPLGKTTWSGWYLLLFQNQLYFYRNLYNAR
jgi:hypothetical protein